VIMPHAPSTFQQADVIKTIKAAVAAGMDA
jgi:hypothetical protein